MEKKHYEKPEVTKVDFKFEEAIAASGCELSFDHEEYSMSECKD